MEGRAGLAAPPARGLSGLWEGGRGGRGGPPGGGRGGGGGGGGGRGGAARLRPGAAGSDRPGGSVARCGQQPPLGHRS